MEIRQTNARSLLSGTKVFLIPQFQRHYKWKQSQWLELFEDIFDQYEQDGVRSGNMSDSDGHFLGSVVLHPAPGPATTVARYWVIDGQQRLTTLMIVIAAVRDLRADSDGDWNPRAYDEVYLRNAFNNDNPHRLVLGENDRLDFEATVYGGDPSGQIGAAYRWFTKALKSANKAEVIDWLALERALLLRMQLIEINTDGEDNINQIFHTINHAGMQLTAIDLIRNYSFMQLPQVEAEFVYSDSWRPMETRLGGEGAMARYFWSQLVRRDQKATQRDLYAPFVRLIEKSSRAMGGSDKAVKEELSRLSQEISLFEAIEDPWSFGADLPPEVLGALTELALWGSQTHTPLALELLGRLKSGRISAAAASQALRHVLSYLVRRGLAGTPTNNLNRVLSSIPSSLTSEESVDIQVSRDLAADAKYWPTNSELVDRGRSATVNLTLQSHQLAYIMNRLALESVSSEALGNSMADATQVVPQPLSPEWREHFDLLGVDSDAIQARLNVLGNLTLDLNSAGAKTPRTGAEDLQSKVVVSESMAREVGWAPEFIDARTESLLRMCSEIWIRPGRDEAEKPITDTRPMSFDVGTTLQAMPGDVLVRVDSLAQLCAISVDAVKRVALTFEYPILSRERSGAVIEYILPLAGSLEEGFRFEDLEVLELRDIIQAVERVGAAPLSGEEQEQ